MDASEIVRIAKVALDGTVKFPEIVGRLVAAGVESYHVDYAACSFTFYGPSSAPVTASLLIEKPPPIAEGFDAAALKAAILDGQRHGQQFRDFCARAMRAGVQGYFAFQRGKRVVYFGRQGDQHVDWFPGARPSDD